MIGSKLLAVGLAASIVTGCGVRLFHADFDADPPAMPPLAEPPGPPDADRIYLPSLAVLPDPPSPPVLMVVPAAGFTGNVAAYRNTDLSIAEKHASFIGEAPLPSIEEYWAVWVGNLSGASPLEIMLYLYHFEPVIVLRLTTTQLEVKTSSDPDRFETVGTLSPAFSRHVFVLRFIVDTRQYSLMMLPAAAGGGTEPITSGLRPSLLPAFVDPAGTPALDLRFPTAPNSPLDTYLIDAISITESCPHLVPSGSGAMIEHECS
jgi:hypothetical protein